MSDKDKEVLVSSATPGRGLRRNTPGYQLIYRPVILNPRVTLPDEAREAIMSLAHYADQQMDRGIALANQIAGLAEFMGLVVIEDQPVLDVLAEIRQRWTETCEEYNGLLDAAVKPQDTDEAAVSQHKQAVIDFLEYLPFDMVDDDDLDMAVFEQVPTQDLWDAMKSLGYLSDNEARAQEAESFYDRWVEQYIDDDLVEELETGDLSK